jgi:hypothetical protein
MIVILLLLKQIQNDSILDLGAETIDAVRRYAAELLQQQPRALAKPSVGKNANESRSGV